jgi:hypothetical protein
LQTGVTRFMGQLTSQMHAAVPGSFVTIDTYSGAASWSDGEFRIDTLAPNVDAMFVMGYDMNFSNMRDAAGNDHAGPTAPLNGWTYNDTTSVQQYMSKAPASKIILGVPYYGYKWCTVDRSNYSQAFSSCPSGTSDNPTTETYSSVAGDFGCVGPVNKFASGWDGIGQVPDASWWSPASGDPCGGNHGSWREMYWDDATSLGLKYDLVNNSGIRGAGMWALGYDTNSSDLWNEVAVKFASRWESLGGKLASGATAASSAANRLDVFAIGSNQALYHLNWDGTRWSGWQSLGGRLTSSPAAVASGSNHLDVFARGTDNGLYHLSFDGSNWSGWQPLGGVLTSAPAASSWSSTRLDVVVRGTDNGLYHKSWAGSGWSGWQKLGGVVTSNPAMVSWGTDRIDLFARGTNNALYHSAMISGAWTAWESLGGVLSTGPGVSSWGVDRLDLFVGGSNGAVYHKFWNGIGWSGWDGLDGRISSDPAAVSWGQGRVDVFVRGTDLALWHKALNLF